MEMTVVFNKGRDAFANGLPRVAPETIEYPLRTKWHAANGINENRTQTVRLPDHAKREWLRGYDHHMQKLGIHYWPKA
jgi:hypothetical protein